MIGPENSPLRLSINQVQKLKQSLLVHKHSFASCSLLIVTLSSHWLMVMMYTFVLIGRCDYFGFWTFN